MNVKRGSYTFLKVIILLAGIAVFALCIWLPVLAVRDARVHPNTAYFLIPFLVCAYGFCISLSVALYQAFKLLSYIENNNAFTELSFNALKIIKNCANTVIFLILLGLSSLIILGNTTGEDITGFYTLSGLGILVISTFIAVLNVLQKPVKHYLGIKM